MTHKADIAKKLLSGTVICIFTDQENYQLLVQDDDILINVENILTSLDRKLIQSDSGKAFYAVNAELNADSKKEAKDYFRYLVRDARYYLDILEFFAEASEQDIYIQAGEKIQFAEIARVLTHSNSLQDRLNRLLGNRASSDVSKMASKLLEDLVKDELLMVQDAQNLIYRFTGKLELIQQGLIFIVEQNRLGMVEDDSSQTTQKGMTV
jgi:hypothetical protein